MTNFPRILATLSGPQIDEARRILSQVQNLSTWMEDKGLRDDPALLRICSALLESARTLARNAETATTVAVSLVQR